MYGQSQTSFSLIPIPKDSVHGGAACQSSREGSCSSAELRIFTSIFFIFSLTKQPNTKSANIRTLVVFLQNDTENCHTYRPASRTSGAFLPSVHITNTHNETPHSPTYLYKIQSRPSLVAFRGIFGYSYLNSISENRANALSVFIHRILSFMSKFPLYAVFWGFFSVHNYSLFIKKASMAAVYSGNGVPAISQNSHPQGWSRSELWETQSGSTPDHRSSAKNLVSRPTDSTISKYETAAGYSGNGVPVICNPLKYSEIWPTQKGSIPFPCSCLGNPLCVISAKCEAMYAGKGAPETDVLKHVCGRRKLRGSSPRHSSKHRWMSCMHKKGLVMQSVYARLEGELRASAGMATRKDLLTAWNRHEVVLGEVVKVLLFNAGFDSLHHLFCEI